MREYPWPLSPRTICLTAEALSVLSHHVFGYKEWTSFSASTKIRQKTSSRYFQQTHYLRDKPIAICPYRLRDDPIGNSSESLKYVTNEMAGVKLTSSQSWNEELDQG